jgi:hypothetical protein
VPAPGAGLINGNLADGAPVALCMRLSNIVVQHPPQTSIVLLEQIGHGIDGHCGVPQCRLKTDIVEKVASHKS